MGLKIYSTLTRKKEEFQPLQPGKVGMYVCGMTVYDMCHLGHARSAVLFDVIYRYLMYRMYEVTFVRNFTDVDDKIINRANELGEDWKRLGERFIHEFYVDMDALRDPSANLRAQSYRIYRPDAIAHPKAYLVRPCLRSQRGCHVLREQFFRVGKLSGKRTKIDIGAWVDVDEKKRNPLDFALWKAAKPGEPYWESPWGPGRPGWHIECSAMSMDLWGRALIFTAGGADLTFPHHENEIAQSEAATGRPFAKYWIHNGFVNISAEKMSKSLGNVLNIRDILKTVHPEALRLFLISSHYRSPLEYSETSIKESGVAL